VLSPWRRYSGYSTPRPVVTANSLAFITLQPCRRDSIGKPFAPLLTAGTREFAPRRVTELANLIYREEHFEENHICCAPTRWSLRGRKSKGTSTGNFTKVVQRIRVKIALVDPNLVAKLRPGLSVIATVRTRG
jgi:hypothetical protein